MSAKRLRFLVDRSFGSMTVRAGATVDVPDYWAKKCLGEGSAVPADADPEPNAKQKAEAVATGAEPQEAPKVEAKKPAAKGKKKNG